MNITLDKFKVLISKGFSLDYVFLLKLVENKVDLEEYCTEPKLKSLLQGITRKQLIIDGELSKEGKELLDFYTSSDKEEIVIPKKKEKDELFALWWSTYPASDTFTYKGRKFKGTRALRVKKEDCKIKLNKILATGEYEITELIEALKLEIEQKAENSVRTGINKMSYFQNSLTYLNQGTYDAYVELVKQGHKAQEEEKEYTSNETYI